MGASFCSADWSRSWMRFRASAAAIRSPSVVAPANSATILVSLSRSLASSMATRFLAGHAAGAKMQRMSSQCGGRASARDVPGQQDFAAGVGEGGLAQIPGRVDAVELRCLEQRIEERGDLGTAVGSRPVMILSPDDGTSDAALGGVVIEGDARVLYEACEPVPVGDDVRRSVPDRKR